MVRIREAVAGDIPAMVSLGRKFYAESDYHKIAPFDPKTIGNMFMTLLQSPVCRVLVADNGGELVGFMGVQFGPFPFNDTVLCAQEKFWFVDETHRGRVGIRLKTAMEEIARYSGARIFVMSRLENEAGEGVERLYLRNGYTPLERHYIKRL